MDELVFSTFVYKIQEAWKGNIAHSDLIDLMYGLIVIPCNVVDRRGNPMAMTSSSASNLMTRKENVSPKIRKHAEDEEIIASASQYFQERIVSGLFQAKYKSLIDALVLVIKTDPEIPEEKKASFLQKAAVDTISDFLADIFLYVITRENRRKNQPLNPEKVMPETTSSKGADTHRPLPKLAVPSGVAPDERRYVDALLDVYAQEFGVKAISEDELDAYPKKSGDLMRHRRYYYAAEAVRRGTRDTFSSNEPDHFQILKDEVFDGIADEWDAQHKSGAERLKSVMNLAAAIHTDKCKLVKDTDWVGIPEKKGVCHFLVNENRITGWVREDDG